MDGQALLQHVLAQQSSFTSQLVDLQGVVQANALCTRSLLTANAAQVGMLTSIRSHQLVHGSAAAAPLPTQAAATATGLSRDPTSKAARLALKRTQRWEKQHAREAHKQQTDALLAASAPPAAPTPASAATAPATNAPAGQSNVAPGAAAPGVADRVPVALSTQPSSVHPASSTGLVGFQLNAASSAQEPLQTRPFPPPFMPGHIVPGRDEPEWQRLKHIAFNTISGELSLHIKAQSCSCTKMIHYMMDWACASG